MRRRSKLIIAFPMLMIALLASERLATVLLGYHPSNAEIWRVWFALRSLSGSSWLQAEHWLGNSVALQSAALVVAAVSCCLLIRRRMPLAASFLVNHAALLMAVVMFATGPQATTASIQSDLPGLGAYALPVGFTLDWFAGIVLGLGLLACGYCHFLFVSDARHRNRESTFALLRVERGL